MKTMMYRQFITIGMNNDIKGDCMDQIKNELSKLLIENKELMKEFKSATYKESFQLLLESNRPLFDAIERAYDETDEKEALINDLAEDFVSRAKSVYDTLPKKGAKSNYLMDANMLMGTYIIPCIVEYKGKSSEVLADTILNKWNLVFTQFNLQKGSFTDIDSSFRRKLCYITTAVCNCLNKEDDCYELTLLRNYRDTYLTSQPGGKELIEQYYSVAPQIVFGIDQMRDAKDIYRDIYREYLSPCISLIENQEYEICKQMYSGMVLELENTYLGYLS